MTTAGSLELIAPGSRLGKYEIVHRIAFGGMAEIYLARISGIQGFQKHVVLKRILPQFAAREDFVRMFLREARIAATLDQANIAHVHEIGEIGGSYFFTMEYLHGEDLRQIMRELARRDERLPLEHALAITIDAASGLHYAHEKKGPDGRSMGIVHRDVSPSNVVVTYDGGVKVVDFGIAKMSADPELTRGHAPQGKLAYMSPEQLHNLPVDRRADIFALGVVLFETTTHSRLFGTASEVDTLRRALEENIPAPSTRDPSYPRELEAIVLRALEREPDRRYSTARDMQRDLEAFARTHGAQISSGALAEWMERTFGPKLELWHTLPPAPTVETTPATSVEDRGDQTRVVSRPDVVIPPPAAGVVPGAGATGAVDVARTSAPPLSPARPVPSRRAARVVAFGVAAMVALFGFIWLGRGRPVARAADEPQGHRQAPAVMLVADQGNVAVDPGLTGPRPPAAAGRAAAPESASAAGVPARVAARHRGAGAKPGFSASLAHHEGELRLCFANDSTAAANTAEVSFRFQIGADGRVRAVTVLPEALGATPLGACLAKVGGRTVFAPQPTPVTVRIPLTLRVQGPDRAAP